MHSKNQTVKSRKAWLAAIAAVLKSNGCSSPAVR